MSQRPSQPDRPDPQRRPDPDAWMALPPRPAAPQGGGGPAAPGPLDAPTERLDPAPPGEGEDEHEGEAPGRPADAEDAAYEDEEEGDEDEPHGVGCGSWLLVTLFLCTVLGGAGYFGVMKLLEHAPIEQLRTAFRGVSLLPDTHVEPLQPDSEVKIYYAVRGRALTAETRRLPHAAEGEERAHLIARELLKKPKSALLESALPPGTDVRGLYVRGGIVLIDLSEAFAKPASPSPSGERLAVYSIVDSFLLNDSTLRGVRILVDGQAVPTAWGWLDLSQPLGADLSLIQ